jgi:hypothetical protein
LGQTPPPGVPARMSPPSRAGWTPGVRRDRLAPATVLESSAAPSVLPPLAPAQVFGRPSPLFAPPASRFTASAALVGAARRGPAPVSATSRQGLVGPALRRYALVRFWFAAWITFVGALHLFWVLTPPHHLSALSFSFLWGPAVMWIMWRRVLRAERLGAPAFGPIGTALGWIVAMSCVLLLVLAAMYGVAVHGVI